MPYRALALAVALSVSLGAHAERLTQKCNATPTSQVEAIFMPAEVKQRILDVVAEPARDPALYYALWEPTAARDTSSDIVPAVSLTLRKGQDVEEIIAAMFADPLLRTLGISNYSDNLACPSPPAGVPVANLTEYFNTNLLHYFVSSSEFENGVIDAGDAGPGWVRTGQNVATRQPDICVGNATVWRFYAPGPNSHFYTVDPVECGGLRKPGSGWILEGAAFGARLPVAGVCTNDRNPIPLYRAYNNRWMFNDTNHRFSRNLAQLQGMAGWTVEGLAMCLAQ
ncbi:MAG: hypothetical protein ABI624_21400 [Casimicrobiaceae bacterium]